MIVGRAHDLGFRFVIKRELEMLPTIDIGGRCLYERWQELDDWIGEVRSGGAVAIGAKA
jgi:hypothetical protein